MSSLLFFWVSLTSLSYLFGKSSLLHADFTLPGIRVPSLYPHEILFHHFASDWNHCLELSPSLSDGTFAFGTIKPSLPILLEK